MIATGRQESVRRFIELAAAEMVASDKEEARKQALLRLRGFKVVGSMENPPSSPAPKE